MDTATPAQEAVKPAPDEKHAAGRHAQDLAAHKKNTRVIRYLLKGHVDENSALIPDDKWALNAAWDFAKKNKSLHKTAGGTVGFAFGSLLTVVAGVVGAFLVTGAAPIAAVAVGAIAVAGFLGKKSYDFYNKFKTETLPELRADIGRKYLELKVGEVKAAWAKKKEEHEKKKAAEKAAKALEAAKPVVAPVTAPVIAPAVTATEAPKPEVKKPEEKKPEVTPAPVAKADDKPQTAVGAVGSWLLKKALEQANKKKDPAPPAVQDKTTTQDNQPPAAEKKKEPPPPKVAA